MEIHILLFYKFVKSWDFKGFAETHLAFCNDLEIKGKVLVSHEGINGSVSGTKEQVEKYKANLRNIKEFSDIAFKEEPGSEHPFKKMKVKIKDEIIRLDKPVDLNDIGEHISPEEFLKLYDSNENFIILDARNNYESKVGKFKNAITPDIKTFREFPEFVENFKENKDKKIVMYCTGGIRCEKASAYMKSQGFSDVKQLNGGIINFCQNFPDTVWEGKCFVFDKRLVSDVGNSESPITSCVHCGETCGLYRNCKNPDCDAFTVICESCDSENNGCCSAECSENFKEICVEKAKRFQGRKDIQLIENNGKII